jgi:putative Holliday junction resolvase
MKYLGIDYGSKFVGIAISDGDGTIAFPRIEIENDEKLLSFLVRMIEQEKVEGIVVGDTRTVSGTGNSVTPEAENFMNKLAQLSAVPIERASEAWSSIEASRYAPKGEQHNNAAAAAIILQRFLDMRGNALQ